MNQTNKPTLSSTYQVTLPVRFMRARSARLSNESSASATQEDYRISLLLRFALWYCVRIRAKETFAVEVDHVVRIFGNPYLGLPGDV